MNWIARLFKRRVNRKDVRQRDNEVLAKVGDVCDSATHTRHNMTVVSAPRAPSAHPPRARNKVA